MQVIRNTFIRLEGFLYQLLSFIRNIFAQIFGFLARLFGFSKSGYFLETDEATTIKKSTQNKQITETQVKTTPEIPVTNRRRPDPKMDYFRKMAEDVTKAS